MDALNTFTHIDNPEDVIYLRSTAFPVNIRLVNVNPGYKALVQQCCSLVKSAALNTYHDYKQPHGMSGANLAIPFNIIGVVIGRNTVSPGCRILINPKILSTTPPLVECTSNCGSIRLDAPIIIKRYRGVVVEFYDENFNKQQQYFDYKYYGATIQHEIDHNNGILITDRV